MQKIIKPKTIWFISILLFILHSGEEYLSNFPMQDPIIKALSNQFVINSTSIFLVAQLFLLIILLIPLFEKFKSKWPWVIVGIVLLLESDHIIRAVLASNYYPGVITAIPLMGMGILFAIFIVKNEF